MTHLNIPVGISDFAEIRQNGYEAIMRSHAILRGFRHDLGLDIADNLFSCDYGGSAYDRGI